MQRYSMIYLARLVKLNLIIHDICMIEDAKYYYESGPIFFNDRSFYKIHIRKLRQKERNQFMQT